MAGLSRKAAVAHLAATYGWAPERVDRAILKLADHFGSTNEVYYPDPTNYRQVTVVWIKRVKRDSYEISEENRPARLAAEPRVRYSKRVPTSKAALQSVPNQEATVMATRTAAKRPASKAKAAPAPEPEEVEEELEELEDEELEDVEDVEDEAEEAEDEDVEEDEEDEEQDEDEDEDDEEVQDEADEGEEEAKDYTVYAGKAITPTMQDFHDWLNQEVGDLSEMDTARVVALAGTLRMEFQRSEFCHDRREERKAEAAAAKAAPKPKATKAAKEEAPAKTTKAAPAAKTTKAPVKTATKAAAPAKPAARKPGTAPGKPAPRAADRPAATRKAPARRGKGAEAPF